MLDKDVFDRQMSLISVVPYGEVWCGSPSVPISTNYIDIDSTSRSEEYYILAMTEEVLKLIAKGIAIQLDRRQTECNIRAL